MDKVPNYLNFSRVEGRERLNEGYDLALYLFQKIADAPEAAKRNMMQTDWKIAVGLSNHIKMAIQAESANAQAMAVIAARTTTGAEDARGFCEANVPGLMFPDKKTKALAGKDK